MRHQQNFLSDTDKRRQRRGRVSDGSTLPDALSSLSSRGLSALTTHLIWQTCAVLKQGATTDCVAGAAGSGLRQRESRRRQQAADSRRRVNDDTLHVCQVGGNGSGSALNIDEGALSAGAHDG